MVRRLIIATGLAEKRHTVRVRAGRIVANSDLVLTLEKLLGKEEVGEAVQHRIVLN